jgi:uncharacterized protein YqgC (DUF456 family)
VTGILGAFGVTPAMAIIVGLLCAALVIGLVQARRETSIPTPAVAQ